MNHSLANTRAAHRGCAWSQILSACALFLFVVWLTGCGSVPLASREDDSEARSFHAPSGMSNLYISYLGRVPHGWPINIDGAIIGDLSHHTYFLVSVPAGRHRIVVGETPQNFLSGETLSPALQRIGVHETANPAAAIDANTEAGKNYFFVVDDLPAGAWSQHYRIVISQQREEAGRKRILRCRRAQAPITVMESPRVGR